MTSSVKNLLKILTEKYQVIHPQTKEVQSVNSIMKQEWIKTFLTEGEDTYGNVGIDSPSKQDKSSNTDENITLSITSLRNLDFQKNYMRKDTQEDYYRKNGSPSEIVNYAGENNKVFGANSEKIAKEWFLMDNSDSSCYDHIKCGKTIEQKSMRLGSKGNEGKFQHIELKHHWDYLLLCKLELNGFSFSITSRKNVEYLVELGIITGQGKKGKDGIAEAQQAYWFEKNDFKKKGKNFDDYFRKLTDETSLIEYIQSTST